MRPDRLSPAEECDCGLPWAKSPGSSGQTRETGVERRGRPIRPVGIGDRAETGIASVPPTRSHNAHIRGVFAYGKKIRPVALEAGSPPTKGRAIPAITSSGPTWSPGAIRPGIVATGLSVFERCFLQGKDRGRDDTEAKALLDSPRWTGSNKLMI